MTNQARLSILLLLVFPFVSCGDSGSPTKPTPPAAAVTSTVAPAVPAAVQPDAVFAGAGDIGMCGSPDVARTAELLEGMADATVFTLGDNAYMHGSLQQYMDCYDPTWGRFKRRTRPSPGNHEYETQGAAGYFAYFGMEAGTPGLGYYRFKLGSWQVYSLNSSAPAGSSSAQYAWLKNELTLNPSECALAYWHHPVRSSGQNGDNSEMVPIWELLANAGAEVVLSGHDHHYERFSPQDASLRPAASGLRQFVVGTGGAELTDFVGIKPGSQERIKASGVLRLNLRPDSYDWQFVPVVNDAKRDFGTEPCH